MAVAAIFKVECRCSSMKKVEHVYFYGVSVVDEATRKGYLQSAYRLGNEFVQ